VAYGVYWGYFLQYLYKINHSQRAKYIRLKINQKGDLSVTLPSFTKAKHAHDFVFKKRTWIEKHLVKIRDVKKSTPPTSLDLKLLNERWTIVYSENDNKNLILNESDNFIIRIHGKKTQLSDLSVIAKLLNQWCKKRARVVFNAMLQELAELHGFHYQRLSIRSQKTRWGSCSHKKNINLNSKLLFMPKDVVEYVMIHELCHTIEMNHSQRFWSLVEECDPNYRINKLNLKKLGHDIAI